jgi:5-hydroxyisourate hydrolase
MKSPITTHVLDLSTGIPAEGISIELQIQNGNLFEKLSNGTTNSDGRIANLLEPGSLKAGTYKMIFETKNYFEKHNLEVFYPYAEIVFNIVNLNTHYHIPLLLSPYGYSTYKGS